MTMVFLLAAVVCIAALLGSVDTIAAVPIHRGSSMACYWLHGSSLNLDFSQ
jgi:hypothetical protein